MTTRILNLRRGARVNKRCLNTATIPLLLSTVTLLTAPAFGDVVTEAWVRRYTGPVNSDFDGAKALAVDSDGNVYVTGNVAALTGASDYLTIAYSSAGVPLWTNFYDGPVSGDDRAVGIAFDGTGAVYVTGYSTHSDSNPSVGYDYATIKYSKAGVPLWTNRYDGPAGNRDSATAVSVDRDGSVIVTGYSIGVGTGYDYATVKYSSAGLPLWTNRYDGAGGMGSDIDCANALVVGPEGTVFVTGYSRATPSGDHSDCATIGYSGTGVPLWTNLYVGLTNGCDEGTAAAVDDYGNLYVTGTSQRQAGDWDFCYLTLMYTGAGEPVWINRYRPPQAGFNCAVAAAVNESGGVYVTGYSESSTSSFDYATIAYSISGLPLWTNIYNGPGNAQDQATALAARGHSVYVTGFSLSSAGDYDYATIKYSSAGAPLWTNRYDGPAHGTEAAMALALDSSGNVFVTGHSSRHGMKNYLDFATVKYAAAPTIPVIRSAALIGTNLFLSGEGGNPGGVFYIVASTNVATVTNNWMRLASDTFGADGNFSVSNALAPVGERGFFRLLVP